ncbi:MAG TPA: hypothetical protein VJ739_09125 [Gemmataceae bacterium]|nr:hypothetical protein [Gemmataceae bacterium]
MGPDELRRLAEGLLADYDARTPGRRLPEGPDLTTTEAYALQDEVACLRERRGEKVIGYKVGCTSRAIREQLGVAQPVFGRVFATGCLPSGARLARACYARLGVEGELAVRLGRDVAGAASTAECLGAIDAVFPVIELHHHVLPAAWSPGLWLVASNGMHAGFVRGDAEKRCPGPADFRHRLSIHLDGVAVETFEDSGRVPGPVRSLRWLAGRLAAFGRRLTAGQVVLTGSAMKLYPTAAVRRILVDAGPLGRSCAELEP